MKRTVSNVRKSVLGAVLVGLVCLAATGFGWVRLADVSGQPSGKPVKGGGSITALGDEVYLMVGNNTRDFLRYTNSANAWAVLDAVPLGDKNRRVKKGACLTDDGEAWVYALKGANTNQFFAYNPETGWDATLPYPGFAKPVKGGFACGVKLGSARFVYAGCGSNSNEWLRFDVAARIWQPLVPATLPEKAKVGSGLAFDGTNTLYLLLARGKESFFYALDLNAPVPTWVAKAPLPAVGASGKKKKVKEGGSLEFYAGKVYAVKGGSSREFWSFDPAANAWTQLADVPSGKGIKCGHALAAGPAGMYCLIGKNTNEFWYEPIVAGDGLEPTPGSGAAGTAILRPGELLRLPLAGPVSFTVHDASGRTVLTRTGAGGSGLNLTPGVYVVRYSRAGQSGVQKVVVR